MSSPYYPINEFGSELELVSCKTILLPRKFLSHQKKISVQSCIGTGTRTKCPPLLACVRDSPGVSFRLDLKHVWRVKKYA